MSVYRSVVLAAAAAVLALLGCLAKGTTNTGNVVQPFYRHYVALGDSYASGPGIPDQRTDPIGCERSTSNYPALLAKSLGIPEYTDVSCGGAVIEYMTERQPIPPPKPDYKEPIHFNPPQFGALKLDTDLVTVTIGANNINIVGGLWMTCAQLGLEPNSNPCQQHFTRYSDITMHTPQRIAEVAEKVGKMLDEIHKRTKKATVLLVGYLRFVPPTGRCYPGVSIADGDVPYVDNVEKQFTTMLAEQASKHGAVFVDAYAASMGHDACQPPEKRWVEGVQWVARTASTSPVSALHPNAAGMRAVADLALKALNTATAPHR